MFLLDDSPGLLLFYLLVLHALADFPLQGDFMAKAKAGLVDDVPEVWAMCWHCLIHSGCVMLVTGSATLALIEFATHFVIDRAKINGMFSFSVDQTLHVALKIGYVVPYFFGVVS